MANFGIHCPRSHSKAKLQLLTDRLTASFYDISITYYLKKSDVRIKVRGEKNSEQCGFWWGENVI